MAAHPDMHTRECVRCAGMPGMRRMEGKETNRDRKRARLASLLGNLTRPAERDLPSHVPSLPGWDRGQLRWVADQKIIPDLAVAGPRFVGA